ncbi:hypothetical protein ACXYMU_17505 [Pontibacter sp. CAU 1760]
MKTVLPLTFILSLLLTDNLYAQSMYSGKTARAMPNFIGELSTNVGTGFGQHRAIQNEDIDTHEPKVLGSNYLTDNWCKGKLYFSQNRVLQTEQFKYDIEHNQFLLNPTGAPNPTPDELRVFYNHLVDAFELADPAIGNRYFFNAANAGLTLAGAPAKGFLEVLVNDENLSLYRKVDTELLRANYNVALNAGEKSDRVLKKVTYFIKYADSMEVHQVGNSKRQNKALFKLHQAEMQQYLKTNKVNFSDEAHLTRMVTYYNAL